MTAAPLISRLFIYTAVCAAIAGAAMPRHFVSAGGKPTPAATIGASARPARLAMAALR
jgi:hypothetical protein